MTTPDPDVQGADDTKQVSKDQPDCQPIPEGERGGEERCPTCGGEADKPRCRHLIGWNDPLTPEQREQLRCKDPFHHPAKASSRASSEPASGEGLEGVDRFTPARQYWGTMEPNPEGAWVRYSDASAALEAERRQTEEEAGRAIDFALLIKGHKDRADAAEERAEEAEGRAQSFDSLYREFTSVEYREVQAQRDAAEAKLTRIEKLVERLEQAITNEMLDEIGFYAEVEIAAAEMADLLRGPHGEADTGPSRPASSEDDSGLAGGARVELGADE